MIRLPSFRVMKHEANGSLASDGHEFMGYKRENYYVLARGSVVVLCDEAARDMTKELRV